MSQSEPDYRVRNMNRPEMDEAVSWAANEGWNPGNHDAEPFFATDPAGFFVGERGGEIVGVVSAVAYDDKFGFGGFYMVRPEFRGRGYGMVLFQRAFEYLGERNIGADGVVEQQENYQRAGMRLAYRNIRFGGLGGGVCPDDVTPLAEVDFDAILAYDTAHFPAKRRPFLEQWLAMPNAIGYAVATAGRLNGYGVLRSCVEGFKVGPLFADGPAEAEALYRALASHAVGHPVFLDVPEPNAEAVALARRHAMAPVFETARMYTKEDPDVPLHEIYGVTTFELG